ncbi:M20 family metallo-hydrolase [Acuticoccus sp. M5D2P5]|uniref:M20 family metallo-hydrolase n=1 Tax=Acuticoccus kalidii TaxID=2910977 RepID=UPI001F1AFDD6|nr:M20 family metallo-hydrolase [Acuticoccus kalidii]MCF3935375.1 M20 family metallo-hydrolase [Acuticoccus kalidii]
MTSAAVQHVSEARLWARHMELAQHGALSKGGVCRLALSDEEIAARKTLIAWAAALDLAVSTDAIGNLFFRMEGSEPDLDPVMTGSHIDSQPAGGKFDGAFGVLAAFEVVEAMRAAGIEPRRPVIVVAWMNEEASRFAPGMMGSEAFTATKPLETILAVTDDQGVSVAEAVQRVAAAFPQVPEIPLGFPVHAFLEAHIEQGPILEAEGKPVGVVTGIQGSRRFRVTVTGEEAHAGTEPLRKRKDALLAAIDIVDGLREAFADPDDIVKFTVGRFEIAPNAPSVVAAHAFFSVDLRHPDWPTLKRLGDMVGPIAEARKGPCGVETREIATSPSLDFPATLTTLLDEVATDLGIDHMAIYSAAGHDARQLHYVCPTAMIFVPCAGGISHNEAESSEPGDLADGARVLTEAVVRLSA